MKIRRWVSLWVATAASITVLAGCGVANTNTTTTAPSNTSGNATSAGGSSSHLVTTTERWSSPPAMSIDVKKQYDAVVNTNYGSFTIQLFAKDSPKTVNNFVFLAKHHFYNNDEFFRIVKPFMIQTGDPNNNGTGGPGYEFADELPVKHPYAPGIVAMANAGPNTNGSQFFICTGADSEQLNDNPVYTEFGKVTQGMSVVQKIADIPVTYNPQLKENSKPTKIAYIKSVKIEVH